MPRESRSIPKYGGSEIEYGISSPDSSQSPADLAWQFVSRIRPEWLSGGSFSLWDSRPRLADGEDHSHTYFTERSWRETNILLANGARLYVDGAHPELSIALCRTPKEKLAHYEAADRIIRFLTERHREAGTGFLLSKNNYGFALGRGETFLDVSPELLADFSVSYAHHDNYLMRRVVPWGALIERTIPWLVLRQIFNGQGKVGSHNRLVTGLPWCDFQISQRADFFSELAGIGTMGLGETYPTLSKRPLMNTRDVPYADAALYRRLHVITADQNMCETAYFLTIALTEIHLKMLEDEFLGGQFILTDPVRAFWKISRDLAFQEKISMRNRKESCLPLDLLEEYITLMGRYCAEYGIREPEYDEAVALGLDVVKKLRRNSGDCIGMLDWVTKRGVIEELMARGKIDSFCSHKAISLDRSYGNIDPAKSIFFQKFVQEKHREHRIISDADIARAVSESPPTRSGFQVAVQRLFEPHVQGWHWAETDVWVPEENAYYEIDCSNPLMTEAEYAPLLLGADRHEFLRRALGAGIAKKCGSIYFVHRTPYPEYDE